MSRDGVQSEGGRGQARLHAAPHRRPGGGLRSQTQGQGGGVEVRMGRRGGGTQGRDQEAQERGKSLESQV